MQIYSFIYYRRHIYSIHILNISSITCHKLNMINFDKNHIPLFFHLVSFYIWIFNFAIFLFSNFFQNSHTETIVDLQQLFNFSTRYSWYNRFKTLGAILLTVPWHLKSRYHLSLKSQKLRPLRRQVLTEKQWQPLVSLKMQYKINILPEAIYYSFKERIWVIDPAAS